MTDTAADPRQRLLAVAQAQLLRQGLRQADLVKALMDRTTEDAGGDVGAALKAAGLTARFVEREGWVTGPAWSARGVAWLTSVWALRSNHTFADYVEATSEFRAASETSEAQAVARDRDDRPQDTPPPELRRAAERRRQQYVQLRRGREQGFALDTLMRHLLAGDTSVEAAGDAARHAAAFAATNGWAQGPLWSAAGMQMMLSRWALEEAVPFAELKQHFAAAIDSDDADE